MTSSPDADARKKLWELIKHARYAMLTHRHPDGMLHATPLTTLNKTLADDLTLYFFVSRRTGLAQRLRADGNVNVSYAEPQKDSYVSIAGRATLNEDRALRQRLFNPLSRAWFPGGVDDPELELIQVKILHAEYWDVKESKTTQLFKMAQAAVTGQRPEMGEHRALHVH